MTREIRAVPPRVSLPALELEVLDLWRRQDTFAQSLRAREGGRRWNFYEGPPTANGTPGVHHVEARVFKDIFPRFKTMQGCYVERKAGWDCQGLPVEVAIEKELGLSGKREIEAFGIAEFNARCRESVLRHVGAFEEMTARMGYWVDVAHPYRTMDRSYIESVWWSLKQIFDAGLLYEAYRISPYCPRCETPLSDHELGLDGGYETVVDPSVFVRFPLTSGPLAGVVSLLVWTTTPWTLVANTAVAVHPDVEYVVAGDGAERLVVARALFDQVLGAGWTVETTMTGRDLERWTYRRPFDLVDLPGPANFVVLADYVTTEDGSGLVHQAPAFGSEDLEVARRYDLPVVNPVLPNGHFAADVGLVGGQFFKHADGDLVRELERLGLLFRHVPYEHAYPHCWRCHTPLLYYALPAWYIRTTAARDALLRENEGTTWYPDTIKWGRYGDWLRNNVDWSLSRTRYWGTPLPIWRCGDGHLSCIGSLAELGELAGRDLSELDPHRPYIDDVTFPCPDCGAPARRVSEVIDAWYDSGAMPFAQWGYPYVEGSVERFARSFPAQFICEALDQTRGWFYSLMAIGTLVFDRSPYERVLCLGLLVAEDGRKMSKHLGNIVLPMPLMAEHGADALRWFMACSGSPWAARRIGSGAVQEIVRKVLLTYWNTAAFHSLYARANGWSPADDEPEREDRSALDRWLRSRTHGLCRDVTAALEDFDTQRTGQLLGEFVDELSNWYVRCSRRRFWAGDPAALSTLHETLRMLTLLMAPLTPFVTERVWQDLFVATDPDAPTSVHLASWPAYDEGAVDEGLDDAMALTRRLVELGRAARAEAKARTRQPLPRALISTAALERLDADLLAVLATELNVERVESFAATGDLLDYTVKANFRALGRRFGKDTPAVAAAITAADAGVLAAALTQAGTATVELDGEVQVGADEVIVSERPREGWSVVNQHGETVALDLRLTPELVRAGRAREVVRLLQEARKTAGLEVTDRVSVHWSASGDTRAALLEHRDLVAAEVLATTFEESPVGSTGWQQDLELGLSFRLARARAAIDVSPA